VKSKAGRDQVSVLVHGIDNMICSIRLHATNLSVDPRLREATDDILRASRQIEALVISLASLARKPCQDEQAGTAFDGQVVK